MAGIAGDRGLGHVARYRQQPDPAEHGAIAGSTGGEDRSRDCTGRDRGPALPKHGRPKPPKKPPKWQARVDTMSPWFAVGLAPALQPWMLIAAGAATVVEAKLSSWESYLTLVLFCVLASASYLAMEIYAVIRPDQSQALLARLQAWVDTHTDQVIIVGGPDRRFLAHWEEHLPDRLVGTLTAPSNWAHLRQYQQPESARAK
jgi:hypothetical protein